MIAVVIGIVPGVAAIGDGAWKTPTTTLGRLMNAWLVDEPTDGDYRVLLLGDSRVLPVPSTEYRDGISWALIDDGDLDVRDRWAPPDTAATEFVNDTLDEIASSSTLRAGRLLAPLGIRYVVIPEFDGVVSTTDDPVPVADGLSASLDDQLDLATVSGGFPTLEIYENSAWLPTTSLLTGATAEASTTAGTEALLRANLDRGRRRSWSEPTSSTPRSPTSLPGSYSSACRSTATGRCRSTASRSRGSPIVRDQHGVRRAVGRTGRTAATTHLPSRSLLIALQVVLWAAAIFIALKIRVPRGRRVNHYVSDETLIVLPDAPVRARLT